MSRKKYAVLFRLIPIVSLIALLHIVIFKFSISEQIYQAFQYPLYVVYLFFLVLASGLLFILIKIKETKPEQIGFVFLVLISIQFALSYAFLIPVLEQDTDSAYVEKINFFVIFIIFLAIEVFLTSKLLNDKS